MSQAISNKGLTLEEKEYLRKEYLRIFIDYRNNYIDDVLKDKDLPKSADSKSLKYRMPFLFRILTLALDLIHLVGINDPETVIRCRSFKDFVETIEANKLPPEARLTEKDVAEVKIFLDYMIALLQK